MLNNIYESLNGGYAGLEGEVITNDIYKLREVKFTPTVFIDLGCNVGCTTRFARELFPKCFIIAVEPNPSNIEVFKQFTKDDNLLLIEKAIGTGKVRHGLTAANGSGETYLSSGVGFPADGLATDDRMEDSDIETITLSEIVNKYVYPNDKLIIKLDIEGNEHVILFDETEMKALRRADYICAEIHFYARTGAEWQEVQDRTNEVLMSLETTHYCRLSNKDFWATKK